LSAFWHCFAEDLFLWEIYKWLNKQAITNTYPMNTGSSYDFGDFVVKWAKLNFAVLPIGDNFTMDYADQYLNT
jgi:hypothetical protein